MKYVEDKPFHVKVVLFIQRSWAQYIDTVSIRLLLSINYWSIYAITF